MVKLWSIHNHNLYKSPNPSLASLYMCKTKLELTLFFKTAFKKRNKAPATKWGGEPPIEDYWKGI